MFSGMELSFEEICVLVVKVLLLGVMKPLHSIKRRAKVINSKGYTILLVVGCASRAVVEYLFVQE
jgi:hypothetical protein